MSLAKLHTTEKSRKEWKCRSCGDVIPKGSKVIRFTVGFRGDPQERCSKPECFPKPSERESSMVAEVYAAQESVDFSTAMSKEDIDGIVQEVVEACESVVQQYQDNEMYEMNEGLQERAEMIEGAAQELENWDGSLDDEPEEEDPETWEVGGEKFDDFASAHGEWLDAAREAAESAVNEMELP